MFDVYDDAIPKQYQEELKSAILGDSFPWYFRDFTASKDANAPGVYPYPPYEETVYFQHTFMVEHSTPWSPQFELIRPLLALFQAKTGFEILDITRIIANSLQPESTSKILHPHTDKGQCKAEGVTRKAFLYYLNDSDGDTIFFDNYFTGVRPTELKQVASVSPKQGRLVVFDAFQYHAATTPKNNQRVVINAIMDVRK